MRDYLIRFFADFEYDKDDAEYFIGVYDKICENGEASELMSCAVSAYVADMHLNYETEILGRAKKIAEITGIHTYTTELLVYILLTKRLRELYADRNIDPEIYKNSVLDLKWKLEECKTVKGIRGSFVAWWFSGFFCLERFALGRLQFEIVTSPYDYDKNGIKVQKGVSRVLNVHIPRTGTPMDKESCDRSYAWAREFYKEELGENCVFVCHSWLLLPENKDILPAHTNTVRFMSEYDIVDWAYNEGDSLWRLFDTEERDLDKLPTNGSLRRAYVEHLRKGGRVGWGAGVKIR